MFYRLRIIGVHSICSSGVGGVLLFLLKAALIVAGIAVVVFLIATIAKAISSKKSDGNDSCDCSSQSTAKPVSEKNRSGEQPYEVVPSGADNTEISKYINLNYSHSVKEMPSHKQAKG